MNIVRVPPTSGTNMQSQNKFHLQHNSWFLHWTRGVTLNQRRWATAWTWMICNWDDILEVKSTFNFLQWALSWALTVIVSLKFTAQKILPAVCCIEVIYQPLNDVGSRRLIVVSLPGPRSNGMRRWKGKPAGQLHPDWKQSEEEI